MHEDEYQSYGYEIPALNIFHAINWTAEAWNNITDDVIYRCWQGLALLSLKNIKRKICRLKSKKTDLTANDYIGIDSNLEATQVVDDSEIIGAI